MVAAIDGAGMGASVGRRVTGVVGRSAGALVAALAWAVQSYRPLQQPAAPIVSSGWAIPAPDVRSSLPSPLFDWRHKRRGKLRQQRIAS